MTALILFLLIGLFMQATETVSRPSSRISLVLILSVSTLLAFSLILIGANSTLAPRLAWFILISPFIIVTCAICSKKGRGLFASVFSHYKNFLGLIIISSDKKTLPRSLKVGEKLTNLITLLYIMAAFALSALSGVSNGDAQTYTIPRVVNSLLSRQLFLSSSSVPTQGFHAFGHDYLYAADIYIGNTLSLSLVSVSELIFLFVLSDLLIKRSTCHIPIKGTAIVSSRLLCRLLLIGLPALFYQANNVKNELILAPLALSVVILLQDFFQFLATSNCAFKSGLKSIYHCIFALPLGILLASVSKGYGVLSVIPSFALFSLVYIGCMLNRQSEKTNVSVNHATISVKPIVPILSAILLSFLSAIAYSFEINKASHWSEEYASFVGSHGPDLRQALEVFPLTFFRVLLEGLLNVPAPVRINIDQLFTWHDSSSYVHGGIYEFGAIINQDIAWPGVLFNSCAIATALLLLYSSSRTRFFNLYSSISLVQLMDSFALFALAFSSVVSFFVIVLKLYWQPGFSRYLLMPSILLVPLISVILSYIFSPEGAKADE